MDQTLERLKAGIRTFQRDIYPANAEGYRAAVSKPQQPHTLMITCADSRIEIETVTNSSPGQMFVMRNIGNIVPVYGEALGGVSAVVEYAVAMLKVSHIVICGHSDCGAMNALLAPAVLETLPTVKLWLNHAHSGPTAEEREAARGKDPLETLARLTERNVLLQLKHLKTHPSVSRAMSRGELTLSGWIYDIGSGQVRVSEDGEQTFRPV